MIDASTNLTRETNAERCKNILLEICVIGIYMQHAAVPVDFQTLRLVEQYAVLLLILAVIALYKMVMKPKGNKTNNGGYHRKTNSGSLSKTVFGKHALRSEKAKFRVALILSFLLFSLYGLFSLLLTGDNSMGKSSNPLVGGRAKRDTLGLYTNEIQSASPLIFPHVEHASILKEMGIPGLYILRRDADGSSKFIFKREDKPLSDEEIKRTKDQVLLVKRSFLDHGKMIYKKSQTYPETVVVTLIDFDRYDSNSLVKIVQNRVDYAQKHNYGVYVRWYQEFVPLLNNQKLSESRDQVVAMMMRAAMHAFPYAKKFMFVNEESMIMNLDESIESHLLNPDKLSKAIMRDEHNTNMSPNEIFDNSDMIFMKNGAGQLVLTNFIMKNTDLTKSYLDYMMDPLIRDYRWERMHHAYLRMIIVHSKFTDKTQFISPKEFAPTYEAQVDSSKPVENVAYFTQGDFIADYSDCVLFNSCPVTIDEMYLRSQL
ncbi:hypothetical protein TBLA_0J01160 [Henningerozyma blattae CBS 6284]|uniref:Alpha-1,6-mannosyltransferase n=1 Tax=Henningerozyma blattae (strain ATCC 34711 / CBS 6284 / DSM 70876 / NBRC 10599 / NRRL Y-10934 / UCD 77-7) TaxID=1071380 RepID=I2H9R1_HENB6|nr:hypothetical protein TBLA_0J01160 [Tetrapisispora blattae CBS 6284]CCH63113.1 hypothetical protein TBLA_0J01160 [Tetrapisispora blattae CBS 6284]